MDRLVCPQCGDVHDLHDFQVGFGKPDPYFALPPDERSTRAVFDTDFAVVDETHHFVRGVLEIPIRGERESFGWGIWVGVTAEVFRSHAYAGREGLPPVPAPSTGRIATRLPGYLQTLGLPVLVQPSVDVTKRPTFVVGDVQHPLGDEQRDGIHVERALEHLSHFIHAGESRPRANPHVATLADDGWEIDDAASRFLARDGVNWLPEAPRREAIQGGEIAKLLFAIEAASLSGEPEVHRERMWVEVDHVHGTGADTQYSGTLTNIPNNPGLAGQGMRVWFGPRHVIDIAREADDWQASEAPDVLRCERHGVSHDTYICGHLTRGTGLGFHQAEDPDTPRPDAWCDACDRILDEEGGWSPHAEEAARITLVCAGCYDAAESRNR